MSHRFLLSCTLLPCLFAGTLIARDWHAAPDGSPSAPGIAEAPIDLATALNGRRATAGDTVWLHGGSYQGVFRSDLRGTEKAPIVVRALPGQRAILTGNLARADGAILNVFGGWTVYRDFEITNINAERSHGTGFRPMGVEIQGPHIVIADLVIHETGIGIGVWDNAPDCEIYGNLIFNSGSENTPLDKRHGHGIYVQNKNGAKTIRDNIVFNNFGWGMHVYSNVGALRQITIEGNVAFNNGVQNSSGVRYNNLLVLGHDRPYSAEHIVVKDNYTYDSAEQKPGISFSDANVSLGCEDPGGNRDLILRGNYFAGGSPVAIFCNWEKVTAEENTFVGSKGLVGMIAAPAAVNSYRWDGNHYFSTGGDPGRPQFGFNSVTYEKLEGWNKITHIDQRSSYSPVRPDSVKVFLRANTFEPGRAIIVIYNWNRSKTVDVDVKTVVTQGTRYVVQNVQDYFGPPILTGTADGKPLHLPMRSLPVAGAWGTGRTLSSTSPEFAVFVLRTAGPERAATHTDAGKVSASILSVPPNPTLYTGDFDSSAPQDRIEREFRGRKKSCKSNSRFSRSKIDRRSYPAMSALPEGSPCAA